MTPFIEALRAPQWLREPAASPGGQIPLERRAAALEDLVAALGEERGSPSIDLTAPQTAAAIAALGDAIAGEVARGRLDATHAELAAVNAWARARLLGCVDAHARERESAAAREATLRRLFAAARIVVLEVDTDFRFLWVYDQASVPFSDTSILGRSVWEVGDPRAAEFAAEQFRRVLDTGVGHQTEATLNVLDGTPKSVLIAFEPTRAPSGEIAGVIGVFTDITELKETQSQLSNALGFREQMMAVLAHDLRSPLSVVRGLSSLLARRPAVPEEMKEGLGHIELAGKRMDELISVLLDFSAARFSGTIPMSLGPADLAEVVSAVLDELRQGTPERLLEVSSQGDTRGRFDPARISQLVTNLISNALTHGAKSAPVRVLVDGGAHALSLAVSNAGTPIPVELLPFIFEPFRRGPAGPDQPRGLGLGLYIAKQIAHGHGGVLEVASSAQHGTVFTARFPRAQG